MLCCSHPTQKGAMRQACLNYSMLPLWLGLTLSLPVVFLEREDAQGVEAFKGNHWAVVIGVADYKEEELKLKFTDRDAKEFSKFLESVNGGAFSKDHISVLTNDKVTLSSVRRALGTFLGKAESNDHVVIYLSGHGIPDPKNTNKIYFLPHEADINDLSGTAVKLDEIISFVEEIKAERKILIVDACHSGAIVPGAKAKGENPVNVQIQNEYSKRVKNSFAGTIILTSSGGYQFSQADKKWGGGHSVFTYFLLRALNEEAASADGIVKYRPEKDGIVDLEEAYTWVREQVNTATEGRQVPSYLGNLGAGIPLAAYTLPPQIKKEPSAVPKMPSIGQAPIAGKLAKEIPGEIDGGWMALIQSGSFSMGIKDEEFEEDVKRCVKLPKPDEPSCKKILEDELPSHRVDLRAFYLDRFEVTNSLFDKFVQATGHTTLAERAGKAQAYVWENELEEVQGASWRRPEGKEDVFKSNRQWHPVVSVSWADAVQYCKWAEKRLPTEAEWEYAARAGTGTRYWSGDSINKPELVANFLEASALLLFDHVELLYDDKYERTAPVGTYRSNDWGLYDMLGNVWEWTADWYGRYGNDRQENPSGPATGTDRVIRGGSWDTNPTDLRYAHRLARSPDSAVSTLGFRCAKDLPK